MKVAEAIDIADKKIPNNINKDKKMIWITALIAQMRTELGLNFRKVVLVPQWEELLPQYLVMRIYLVNEDIENYNKEAAKFNDILNAVYISVCRM